MSEDNRYSDGVLVTFENCTAISNIAAGELLAISTAPAAGGGTKISSFSNNTAGFSSTALMGYHFIGIADKSYSANESPVTVLTQGIFEMVTNSGNLTANMVIGYPVFGSDPSCVSVGVANATGDVAIGSLVGLCGSGTLATGARVQVMIRPGAYRWTIQQDAITAATSATAPEALCYPKQGK